MGMKNVLFLLIASVGVALADDWPQWMGEKRDGVWREEGVRTDLPNEGAKVAWRTPVSWGYAGPSVAKGKVYVSDFVITEGHFDGKGQGGTPRTGAERIVALDAKTGKELWKHGYEVTYTVSYPGGPRVTPTVLDGKVYFQGTMGHFTCLDAETGKVLWERDICKEYGSKPPRWGYSSHPLVQGELVYTVAGGDGQVLLALDKDTGKEKWKALSSDEAGYCPPRVIKHAGVEQLFFWYPEAVVSLNPASGEIYWSYELKPIYGISRMVPQVLDNKLYVAGPGKKIAALLQLETGRPGYRELWSSTGANAVQPLNAPPFMKDGVIYGVDSESSALIAVSKETGERLWTTRQPSLAEGSPERSRHGTAFIVYHEGNNQFWLFSETGDLILAELSKEGYKELGRQNILEPTNGAWGRKVVWTHPAFADKSVFARNDKEIVRVDLSSK